MSGLPLDWSEETREIPAGGRRVERRASAAERAALARALELLACDELVFSYQVKPQSDGRFRLDGTLRATVDQACVVTLEPVPASIAEEVHLEFWPADLLAGRDEGGGDRAILGADEPEPLASNGRIETGRLAFEIVSAALDPYPRKEGVEFTWQADEEGGEPAGERSEHPFAALKDLKLTKGEE